MPLFHLRPMTDVVVTVGMFASPTGYVGTRTIIAPLPRSD